MAEFSGAVEAAYYMNEENSLIEVVYTNPIGEKVNYMIEADDNADYRALVAEGYDEEQLAKGTSEYKRVHAKNFGELVNAQAQSLAEEMLGMRLMIERKKNLEKSSVSLDQDAKQDENKVDHVIYDFIRDNNENKEELFRFKLWALEQDIVKEADRDLKSSIRKSKSITSAMAIYNSLL